MEINIHPPLDFLDTQGDLIIVEGERIIHRRAYLRIQRLAKYQENAKKINKIKGNNNDNHRGAPRPCGARPKAAPMVVVSFDLLIFFVFS